MSEPTTPMSTPVRIILDEREHALYEKCKPESTVSKAVLPLGDVSISVGEWTWLIERKSLSDLLSSVKDGRYEEQSYRLQHAVDPRRVVYVIEGVLSTLRSAKERKLVHSIMTSLQVFKGFAVVRTSSVQETADWMLAFADKVYRDMMVKGKTPVFLQQQQPEEEGESERKEASPLPYCSVVKKVKKDNVTPQNMCEIILCQLPGISHVAATAICKAYPSLIQLMDALREDPACLKQITTAPDKNGKSRKLGKNVHAVLANFLMFSLTPVEE